MKSIQLNNGMLTWIDDIDYQYLSQFKWHLQQKEVKRTERGYRIKMCEEVLMRMNIRLDYGVLHKDKDRLNNCRNNLMVLTRLQSTMLRRVSNKSISGYKGVTYNKRNSVWIAMLKIDGKRHYLGQFKTAREAATRYNLAARTRFGELAYLNLW